MPVITCMICGSIATQSLDIDICTKCIKIGNDKTKILAIKKYLEKYPDVNIKDISKYLYISRSDLDRFIEEGSIDLIQDGNKICISQNTDDRDKRRELFKKQITTFYPNSSNVNQNRRNINLRSQLVKDLEQKKESR